MSIDLSSHGKNHIEEQIRGKYANLLQQHELSQQLSTHIENWQSKANLAISQNNPFSSQQEKLLEWSAYYQQSPSILHEQAVKDYQDFCQKVSVPPNSSYWQDALNKKDDSGEKSINYKNPFFQLLLNEWQKQLDKSNTHWQLNRLKELREPFLKQLLEWLMLVEQLDKHLSCFGFSLGVWFDSSLGNLDKQNIEELQRWLNYLKNDKGAQKIAELLGKMSQIEHSSQIEMVQQTIQVQTPIIDSNSKEEIIGLRLGKELEYALPSELALMSDPDTAILFDLKYLESKLMCFELQGEAYQGTDSEVTIELGSESEDQPGPMILCIDTSGSMRGSPENIAKAITLFLGSKAKSQGRKCFVINFSTNIETFEVTGFSGIADLTNFLSRSFHGGTDVAPALRYALKLLQSQDYKKADVLVISDFVMGSLPEDLLQDLSKQKESGNQFNSLVIGDIFLYNRLQTHFDHEWVYNPNLHQIHELLQFTKVQKTHS